MSSKINIESYEAFWLDYIEGNLAKADVDLLMNWLDAHPELKEELDEDLPVLELDNVQFDLKAELKKEIPAESSFANEDLDDLLIEAVEENLSIDQVKELDQLSVQLPWLEKERQYYQATKLIADEVVVFENKESLKKRRKGIYIPLYTKVLSGVAAAAAVLFLMWNIPNSNQPSVNPNGGIAEVKSEPIKSQAQEAKDVAQSSTRLSEQEILASKELVLNASIDGPTEVSASMKESTSKNTDSSNRSTKALNSAKSSNSVFLASAERTFGEVYGNDVLHLIGKEADQIDNASPDQVHFLDHRVEVNNDWSLAFESEESAEKTGLFANLKNALFQNEKIQNGISNLLAFGKGKLGKRHETPTGKDSDNINEKDGSTWALAIGPIKIRHDRYK